MYRIFIIEDDPTIAIFVGSVNGRGEKFRFIKNIFGESHSVPLYPMPTFNNDSDFRRFGERSGVKGFALSKTFSACRTASRR